jgi:mannose-1-phosphate guanylyltransferase
VLSGELIDYAVMKNTARAAIVPVGMGCSDIGSWATLADALADTANADGRVARGKAVGFD